MGRGRQKAKHTKVARDLKYYSPNTDLSALEKELAPETDGNELVDKWADLYPDEEAEVGETTEDEAK
jgi:hypothetical protein